MAELNASSERLKNATAANIDDHEMYNIDSQVFVHGACPDTTHLKPIPKVCTANNARVITVKNKVTFLALILARVRRGGIRSGLRRFSRPSSSSPDLWWWRHG